MSGADIVGLYNYWIVIFLMMTGFYILLARKNLIKSVIGLNVFQTSVFLLYITMGKVRGGTAPIIPPNIAAASEHHQVGHNGQTHASAIEEFATEAFEPLVRASQQLDHAAGVGDIVYSNPLPSVLMLTAIVVGIATTALALALVVRIREDYGTIDESRILEIDRVDGPADSGLNASDSETSIEAVETAT
ncbi:MAG: cation:proton antiporter subunit C [Planctomycetota bacterium]